MSISKGKFDPSTDFSAHNAQNALNKSVVDRAIPVQFPLPVSRSERNLMRCAHEESLSRRDGPIHLFAKHNFTNPSRRELFEHPACSRSKTSLVPAWAGLGFGQHLTLNARALSAIIAVIAISASMSLALGEVFDRPNSYLGDAGWNHCLELWFELGEVTTKVGTGLPLRLRFSSERPPVDGLFGPGWWCPLLESSVTRHGENNLIWTTPGGTTRRLVLVEGHTDFFTELGWASSARIAGDCIRVESEGWQFDYNGGRLESAKTPRGEVLSWRREVGAFPNILDESGSPLLGLSKDDLNFRMTIDSEQFVFTPPKPNSTRRWVLQIPDGTSQTLEMDAAKDGILSLHTTDAESRHFLLDAKTDIFCEMTPLPMR